MGIQHHFWFLYLYQNEMNFVLQHEAALIYMCCNLIGSDESLTLKFHL